MTSSGISIGGSNSAPLQNVTGAHISQVSQVTSMAGTDLDRLRALLADFHREADPAQFDDPAAVSDAVATIEASLASPDPQPSALRLAARSLPALVAGSAVEQTAAALATLVGTVFT